MLDKHLSSGAEPEVAQAAGTRRIRPRSRSVVSRRWCFLDETKTDHCLTKALKTSKIKRTTKAIIPTGSVASANQLRKIPTSIDLLTICGSHKTLVEAPEVKSHPSRFAKITDSMPIKSGDSDKTMIATETLIDSLRINGAELIVFTSCHLDALLREHPDRRRYGQFAAVASASITASMTVVPGSASQIALDPSMFARMRSTSKEVSSA